MTHRPWFPAVLFGVAVLFATEPVHAQFLGGWLPPEKSLRVTASVSAQHNDRWFCGEGRAHCQTGERAVFSDLTSREESRTTSFYLRLQATPWNFLGFSAEIPWHRIRYERYIASMSRPIDALDSNGVGDTYVTARAGRVFGMWGVTAGYGLELPTGDFTIDAFRVPLGQGTLNHVVFLEAGRSLWPAPAYLEAGLLGRFRGTYTTEDGSPGPGGSSSRPRDTGARGSAPTYPASRREITAVSGPCSGHSSTKARASWPRSGPRRPWLDATPLPTQPSECPSLIRADRGLRFRVTGVGHWRTMST